ncbi:MAG: hypothetical protein GY851_35570 [bacterium]|nr:hypothetical protein [bacterium]
MHQSIRNIIAESIRGWRRYGCQPQRAAVENWGCTGCPRWVVVLQHACIGGVQDVFLAEEATEPEAHAVAQAVEAVLWCVVGGGR